MRIRLEQPHCIFEDGQRGNQEDYIWPLPGTATVDDRLFIVCDGMGGHEHGEVASSTFAQGLAEYFAKHVAEGDVVTDELLKQAINHAYNLLDTKDDGNYRRMGTTLTVVCFHKGGVLAAHIGDSRIYHIRPGKGLLYVSRDHSLVFDLYRSGEISLEEMKTYPNKNVITRAVQPGEDRRARPDIVHITDVKEGDYFYLCSDGMLEQMENEELYELLNAPMADEEKIEQLKKETKANRDNHSAYLLRVSQVVNESGDPDDDGMEERTSVYNALNLKPLNEESQSMDEMDLGNIKEDDIHDAVPMAPGNLNTSLDPLDPMDPMAPPPHPGYHRRPLVIMIIALLLASAATLWLFNNKARKAQEKQVPVVVQPPKVIMPVDSLQVPTPSHDQNESYQGINGHEDNGGGVPSNNDDQPDWQFDDPELSTEGQEDVTTKHPWLLFPKHDRKDQ